MVIVLNLLDPDLDVTASVKPEQEAEDQEERKDRTRMTRLQVISITGEIVDAP